MATITFDPALGDSTLRSARDLLERGDVTGAKRVLVDLRGAPWDRRWNAIWAIAQSSSIAALDAWCEADPTSPDAHLLRGVSGLLAAWDARGSGRAESVSEDGWIGFAEWLERAEDDLDRAAQLLPADPSPWALRITVSMGLSEAPAAAKRLLDEALRRDPGHHPARDNYRYRITARWGGSHEQTMAFARAAAADPTAGPHRVALLMEAHLDRYTHLLSFDNKPADADRQLVDLRVRRDVQALFDATMAAPDQSKATSADAWNTAAVWFWLTNDDARLKLCITRIAGRFRKDAWSLFADPEAAVAEAVQLVERGRPDLTSTAAPVRAPGLWKLLTTDYAMLVVVAPALIVWGLLGTGALLEYLPAAWVDSVAEQSNVVTSLTEPGFRSTLLKLGVGLSWLWLLALVRYRSVRRICTEGIPVEGVITLFWMRGDRGRVEYEWLDEDELRKDARALHKNPRTEALYNGAPVTLLVDPINPQRAVIRWLYAQRRRRSAS